MDAGGNAQTTGAITDARRAASAPGTRPVRARSVWLSQLLLAAVVVVVSLVVQTL